MTNKDRIEEKLREEEDEKKDSIADFFIRYKVLVVYCIVILAYYFIRYVVLS